MRNGRLVNVAVVVGVFSGLFCSYADGAQRIYDIQGDERSIRLDGGILQGTIALNGTNVFTMSLTVGGQAPRVLG